MIGVLMQSSPGPVTLCFPMVNSSDVPYDHVFTPETEVRPVKVNVAGNVETVRVFVARDIPSLSKKPRSGTSSTACEEKKDEEGREAENTSRQYPCHYIALKHPMFAQRSKNELYPDSCDGIPFMSFMSLWNQAVAKLLYRYRRTIDIYYCPDYHTSAAMAYLVAWEQRPIPTLITLHNASYQGVILSPFESSHWQAASTIMNLPLEFTKRWFQHDGHFNMLKAGVTYIQTRQNGRGICAVSNK